MATQVNTNGHTPPVAFSEAPASATVEAYDPSGRRWLLTTRTSTTAELLTRLPVMSAWLDDHGWQTKPTSKATTETTEAAPLCAIHGKPMARRTKDGRSWWSCSEKLADGSFCPYRPKGGA